MPAFSRAAYKNASVVIFYRPSDFLTTVLVCFEVRANFEFIKKLGVEYWCFHDRDIAPEGASLQESNQNLDAIIALAKKLQVSRKILWKPFATQCMNLKIRKSVILDCFVCMLGENMVAITLIDHPCNSW